ncbi:MAG: TatD family hydrolase, partial [Pirellulaceae bacterium]|nr:TatD family hydrolase [Pirellulaceae bacterium]
YPDPPIKDQLRILNWQLEVATDLPEAGPIIIHNRKATDEILDALRRSGIPGHRFVFHCFTGSDSELDAILEFGAMVSFTGIVTFYNARNLAASAARTPASRLMVETDSPYLTPEPHRRVRPNEPRYVPCVARFLAEQRGIDVGAFIQTVDENAARFFNLTI